MPTEQPTPIERRDGYLPIGDHGLIGDGETCALVGRDGAISWLCVPRFDSRPLVAGLLDDRRGGRLGVAVGDVREASQRYVDDTGVLVTEVHTEDGVLRITDALALEPDSTLREGTSAAQGRLLRRIESLDGDTAVDLDLQPLDERRATGDDGAVRIAGIDGQPDLLLAASVPLDGLRTRTTVRADSPLDIVLDWSDSPRRADGMSEALRATTSAWERWLGCFSYEGAQSALVRRSAVTLKLLDHFRSGAIVAAPTSSLPEWIGGERNWDYRYAWIRDAAFSVYALRRIGLEDEADAFLRWVIDIAEKGERPELMYDLDGTVPPDEEKDPDLEGYRGSSPVRWGNAAAGQRQHDVFGEMIDCAYQWARRGGSFSTTTWKHLASYADQAAQEWDTADHGIWEVRTGGEVFTYSAAMCQVALDRAVRLAQQHGLPGDVDRWRAEADRITDHILDEAWNDEIGALTMALGGEALDASVLSFPLRRILPADHPKMVATTDAIAERLGVGHGLLHRYDPTKVDDGVEGDEEGAFLLCSFWLVDNLALQGRIDEAQELYDDLCGRANHLGLLPEQVEPESGEYLGNFPQAFSHVGVISSGVTLDRVRTALAEGRPASLAGSRGMDKQ